METLPFELVSIIISFLNYDTKKNFAWAFPQYKDEVERLNQPRIEKNISHMVTSRELWYYNGDIEREIIHKNGYGSEEFRREKGKIHYLGGPAYMCFSEANNVRKYIRLCWLQNGEYYRVQGPTCITFDVNKIVKREWHQKGLLHNINEPAVIKYHDEGKIYKQIWYNLGVKIKSIKFDERKTVTTVYHAEEE